MRKIISKWDSSAVICNWLNNIYGIIGAESEVVSVSLTNDDEYVVAAVVYDDPRK